jgi:hypothetical protein
MPMLDANDPAFQEHYPNGAIVRDRLGRRLWNVIACDPETGEVISVVGLGDKAPGGERYELLPAVEGQLRRCREFYPAPLTIEPRQWLHIGVD